jgi:hypothetical protein
LRETPRPSQAPHFSLSARAGLIACNTPAVITIL